MFRRSLVLYLYVPPLLLNRSNPTFQATEVFRPEVEALNRDEAHLAEQEAELSKREESLGHSRNQVRQKCEPVGQMVNR